MSEANTVEWMVIVNPNAGSGRGKKDWSRFPDFSQNTAFHTKMFLRIVRNMRCNSPVIAYRVVTGIL
jgi:hypothetical protein